MPIATEFVSPLVGRFLQDLVTWGFIGARTSASQIHREFVSSLTFPTGFKNTIEGYLDIPIDAIAVSRAPHSFLSINKTG
ncbi:3-deoxy-7-phosphoheptulonate synthase, partial [Acinetobacter baumannii]